MKKIIYTLLLGLLLTLPLLATSNNGRNTINLAGKQRMLTQKMSKEALLIIKGIEVKKNRDTLQKTITLFDKTLHGLRDGDKTLQLSKTEEKSILKEIDRSIKLWNLFKVFLKKIIEGEADKETLKAIEIANIPLLKIMDNIVQLYEKKYTSNLSSSITHTINVAGRERMLIQKMTKELLLIANNTISNAYIKSLQTDGQLFHEKLAELMKEKNIIKANKLTKKIEEINELWEKYHQNIANTELTQSGIKAFNKKEKDVMEKMTQKLIEVALSIDAKRYHIDLGKTEKLFDTTLIALMEGSTELGIQKTSHPEIQKQLKMVQKLWKEYQPTIKNVDTSQEGLYKAMEINMPLLKEMDRAVKLYEIHLK